MSESNFVQVEYAFTAEQYRTIVIASLEAKADVWEEEARGESLRGAANQSMMQSLRWGANQLREIGKVLKGIPLVVLVDVPAPEALVEEAREPEEDAGCVGPSGNPDPDYHNHVFSNGDGDRVSLNHSHPGGGYPEGHRHDLLIYEPNPETEPEPTTDPLTPTQSGEDASEILAPNVADPNASDDDEDSGAPNGSASSVPDAEDFPKGKRGRPKKDLTGD